MYVLVKLLNGFTRPLYYSIPEKYKNKNLNKNLIGALIKVPLRKKNYSALVINIFENLPKNFKYNIKEFIDLESIPEDSDYINFVEKISKFYLVDNLFFYKRIINFLKKDNKRELRNIKINKNLNNIEPRLTNEQQVVFDYLYPVIFKPEYKPVLLWGVTGSGKTEVYKKLIIESINNNKSAILLLPEVGLSIQFKYLLQSQLPEDILVLDFHSACTQNEKKFLWQKLLEKRPVLIIGVHLPILLPINNLGLIIVDEEHESNYQEKRDPRINSKELAIWRAQHYKIPILLGSATPSINSLFNVEKFNWKLFKLEKRYAGNFPEIKVVTLKNFKQDKRANFWISSLLKSEIEKRLSLKEQVIIYINRRGHSFFTQCKNCGYIFQCPNCSVSLTLHEDQDIKKKLFCHYCDFKKNYPELCPECKTNSKEFLNKGIGTQLVVKILKDIFPKALIERADLDTASKKRNWVETLKRFKSGEIDILVGTQLITKGYNFNKVTLVGVLWADLNLSMPIFNASETTLQKLIQVAGRAGRRSEKSLVIVQAIQEHDIFEYLNEVNYLEFYKKELEFRKLLNYPPFYRLIQIDIRNKDNIILEQECLNFLNKLKEINQNKNLNIQILGPSKPLVYKIKKVECRQIFLKSESFGKIQELLKNNNGDFKSKISVILTQ